MANIQTFHTTLDIQDSTDVIDVVLDDWYDTDQILKILGKAYQVKTLADLVVALQADKPAKLVKGLIGCRLRPIVPVPGDVPLT